MKCRLHPKCDAKAETLGFCSTHYRKRLLTNRTGYVNSVLTLARIQGLRDLGWSYHSIGQACGKWHSAIRDLSLRKPKVVRSATHAAVMGIKIDLGSGRLAVDPTGTVRRIRALNWMGWTTRMVSEKCGLKAMTLSQLAWKGTVSAGTRVAVAKVYEEIRYTKGPSSRIAALARTRGWAPPAAWDDDTIDDPKVRPCGVRRAA